MLKLLICLPLIFAAMVFSLPKPASASGVFNVCNTDTVNSQIKTSTVCKDINTTNPKQDPVITVIKTAIEILSFIIGIASVVTIVISGLRMILAGGNPENISGARSAILYAVIGMFVAIFSQLLVVFVLDRIK